MRISDVSSGKADLTAQLPAERHQFGKRTWQFGAFQPRLPHPPTHLHPAPNLHTISLSLYNILFVSSSYFAHLTVILPDG